MELPQAPQYEDVPAAEQVKQEPMAFSVDVKIKHESVDLEPGNTDGNSKCNPNEDDVGLSAKSLQKDRRFTVRVDVKHEGEVSPELQRDDVVTNRDAIGPQAPQLKKPDVDLGVKVLGSNCDSDAEGVCALRQIVAGCYVNLERLRPLQCDICTQVFQRRSQLVTHFFDHHAGETDSSQSDDEKIPDDFTEEDTDNPKLYTCKICHEQSAFKSTMELHKLKHSGKTPPTCDVCKKEFTRKFFLERHMVTHVERPDKYCGKRFTIKSSLTLHVRMHTKEKPFSCSVCNKRFTNKYNLKYHSKMHSDKKYTCDVCKKQYWCIYTYRRHKSKHTGKNLFSCSQCDRSFTKRIYLVEHTNIHEGVKAYACEMCGKSYFRKEHLKSHISYSHKDGKKTGECKVCGKTFSLSYIPIHNRIHTGEHPYKCDICNQTFHRKLYFTRHQTYHTNVKPFVCDYCEKPFRYKWDLVVHIRNHTGEKKFKCEFCKKPYASRSNLLKHRRVHHGIKQ